MSAFTNALGRALLRDPYANRSAHDTHGLNVISRFDASARLSE